jgi:hypothetical protein
VATVSIRDVSLFVEVVGRGYPLLLMHGGPGADQREQPSPARMGHLALWIVPRSGTNSHRHSMCLSRSL